MRIQLFSCLFLVIGGVLQLVGPAYAGQWAHCANEGKSCVMVNTGRNLVRYGVNDQFVLLETEGLGQIDCNNFVFGDPKPMVSKHCDYQRDTTSERRWVYCSAEDGNCQLPGDGPRRVRYGTAGRWVIKIESSAVACVNSRFYDVVPGTTKACEYEDKPFPLAKAEFTDCATEGKACDTENSVDLTLFRFGLGNVWEYRMGIIPSLSCSNNVFGDPAPYRVKFCQYSNLQPLIAGLVGSWRLISSCQGECTLSEEISVGVTGARSTSRTETWSKSVTKTVGTNSQVNVPGGTEGETRSTSNTEIHAISNSVQDTLSRSVTRKIIAICKQESEFEAVSVQRGC